MSGGEDDDIGEEAARLLEQNFARREGAYKNELEDEQEFGSVTLGEYTQRYRLDIELGDGKKVVEIEKGNHRKFWTSLKDMAVNELSINQAIRRNYTENQQSSRGEKLRELEPILDDSWEIHTDYLDDFKELIEYCDETYFTLEEE